MEYTKQNLATKVQDVLHFDEPMKMKISEAFTFDDCTTFVNGCAEWHPNNSAESVLDNLEIHSVILHEYNQTPVVLDDKDLDDIERLIIW